VVANRPKYEFFNGGGENDRFRRQQWRKEEAETGQRLTPRIKDPGPFPGPGWMYNLDLRETTDKHGTKFELPRAPLTAR